MTLYIAAGVVLLCFFVLRLIRAIGFLRDWEQLPPGQEKRTALFNFIIHFVIILVLLAGIYILAVRVYRLKQSQEFYDRIYRTRI